MNLTNNSSTRQSREQKVLGSWPSFSLGYGFPICKAMAWLWHTAVPWLHITQWCNLFSNGFKLSSFTNIVSFDIASPWHAYSRGIFIPFWGWLREGSLTWNDTQLVNVRARTWTQVFKSLVQCFPFHIDTLSIIKICLSTCPSIIHPSIQQICIEGPLCVRYSTRHWRYVDNLGRIFPSRNSWSSG